MRVSSRPKLIGSERKQDGIEPAACIDGMGSMMMIETMKMLGAAMPSTITRGSQSLTNTNSQVN